MNGRTVAHCRIIAKPDQGGMHEAPHATDTKLRCEVVIKILPPLLWRMLGA
jgi:hypothetical protein